MITDELSAMQNNSQEQNNSNSKVKNSLTPNFEGLDGLRPAQNPGFINFVLN